MENQLRYFILTILFCSYDAHAKKFETEVEPFTVNALANEVLTETQNPHVFDWRKSNLEIEFGYDYIDEFNNFDTKGWHLGLNIPTSSGLIYQGGFRRFEIYTTDSSKLLGKTPFKQAAQPNRYELYAGFGYLLLEGIVFTRLSYWLSDFQHNLMLGGGIHFTHPNQKWIPARKDEPTALSGQDISYAQWNMEYYLRWNLYMPSSVGIFFQGGRQFFASSGVGKSALNQWDHYTVGVLWAFGAK